MACVYPCLLVFVRFNGAADNNRRNDRCIGASGNDVCASMGPPITIGGMRARTGRAARTYCFNGAADNNRRNDCGSWVNSWKPLSFNGAADNNRRNAPYFLRVTEKANPLQWGRR